MTLTAEQRVRLIKLHEHLTVAADLIQSALTISDMGGLPDGKIIIPPTEYYAIVEAKALICGCGEESVTSMILKLYNEVLNGEQE